MAGLAEALEGIVDAVIAAIQAEVADSDGPLSGVAAVVRGDRARPMPKLPAIWVIPEPASAQQTEYGDDERWSVPITAAALVKDDDPEAAGRACVALAAEARAAVLRAGSKLGLDYVIDVRSLRFDALSRTAERNRDLHWADATVRVEFDTSE